LYPCKIDLDDSPLSIPMNVVDFLGVVTMAMTTLRMLGARFKEAEVGFLGHVNNYRLYIYIFVCYIYKYMLYDYNYGHNYYVMVYRL
jgi:hypothetical protein